MKRLDWMLFGVCPIINTSGSILVWVLYEESTWSPNLIFLNQTQLSFNFLLFKHHYHNKMRRCLLKKLKLTLIKRRIPMGIRGVTRCWEYLTGGFQYFWLRPVEAGTKSIKRPWKHVQAYLMEKKVRPREAKIAKLACDRIRTQPSTF